MWPFKYPHTNFHELNLDWILETVKSNTDRISTNELKIKLIGGDDPLNALHPIGSIFMSISDTSPAALFGGTWEQLKDVFLIGSGGNYALASTGGEAAVTLTVNEMPSHTHTIRFEKITTTTGTGHGNWLNKDAYFWADDGTEYQDINALSTTGGEAAHNNMPPYLAVNMWKRVS